MDIRPLGTSGVSVSSIGLGGWELKGEGDTSPADARAVIEASLDAGVNWIDTAEVYHERANESLIGAALDGIRDRILISSKVAPRPDGTGFRPEQVREACLASLHRLRTDHLDIYFLHYPDETNDARLAETWDAMSGLAREGFVRAIGLSNYELGDIERLHTQRTVDVIQQGLSMVDHLEERPVIGMAGLLGIGTVAYEPLASGVLTGAIRSGDDVKEKWGEDIEDWTFFKRLFAPGRMEDTLRIVEGIARIGVRHDASPAQIAVAWVLHQPGVISAICGTTKPDHVRDNAGAAAIALRRDDLEELDALVPSRATAS
jgi:aryl-alcohol dehydrogenase-like predicted oxidoreductase